MRCPSVWFVLVHRYGSFDQNILFLKWQYDIYSLFIHQFYTSHVFNIPSATLSSMTVTFSSSHIRRLRKLIKMPFVKSSLFTSYASASTHLKQWATHEYHFWAQSREIIFEMCPVKQKSRQGELDHRHHRGRNLRGISKHYICCHLDQSWLHNDVIIRVSTKQTAWCINTACRSDEQHQIILITLPFPAHVQ